MKTEKEKMQAGETYYAFDPGKDIAAFCQSDRTAGAGGRAGRRE